MEIKTCCFTVLVLVVCTFRIATSAKTIVDFKEYTKCAKIISTARRQEGCRSVTNFKNCVKSLILRTGRESSPICKDMKKEEFCSVFDNSLVSPMSDTKSHSTMCRSYSHMSDCIRKECGPGGNKFVPDGGVYQTFLTPDQCSVNAIEKCVKPIEDITKVSKEICPKIGQAKNCFLDALSLCGGSDQQMYGTDLITNGLVDYVEQCKAKKFSFSEDGSSMCVPNPVDVFRPESTLKMASVLDKDTCVKILDYGDKLEDYLNDCNGTEYNRYIVAEFRDSMTKSEMECLRKGYKSTRDGANSGVRSQSGVLSTLMMVFTTLLVIGRCKV